MLQLQLLNELLLQFIERATKKNEKLFGDY